MGIKTDIAWCDSTVNPIVGCDGCELHRAGCAESHCYAASLVGRYRGLPGWPASFDRPQYFAGRLEKAIRWPDLTGKERPDKPWLNGYPRLIFVCDLSDPFTETMDPESWLTPALPVLADSPHVYILLTKRGRRMLKYWQRHSIPANIWQGVTVTAPRPVPGPEALNRLEPLWRVREASVRFISLEPLLAETWPPGWLDWVIVGAESGRGARPMKTEWVRNIRDRCTENNIPFFFKQDAAAGVKIPLPLLDGVRHTAMPRWQR